MNLILIELQKNNNTVAITPAKIYNAEDDALQEFFSVCSYAVKSDVDVHTVLLLQEDGTVFAKKTFTH